MIDAQVMQHSVRETGLTSKQIEKCLTIWCNKSLEKMHSPEFLRVAQVCL